MSVAREIQAFLDAAKPPTSSVGEIRAWFEQQATKWDIDHAALRSVENRSIPGPAGDLAIRVYTPVDAGPLPVLLFFHGGGFMVGSLETYDAVCHELAARSGRLVVSVDYRLAPEHPFPAAADDCFAALQWTATNAAELGGDPERLAVAGDSAGGTLTAVTALRARDLGGPDLTFQILLYPMIDASCDTTSMREYADGYFAGRDGIRMSWGMYVIDEGQRSNAYAVPVRATDVSALPPALVVSAEFDPLRDEGEAYADRLAASGVSVEKVRFDGMIHGFVQMLSVTPRSLEALDLLSARLREIG